MKTATALARMREILKGVLLRLQAYPARTQGEALLRQDLLEVTALLEAEKLSGADLRHALELIGRIADHASGKEREEVRLVLRALQQADWRALVLPTPTEAELISSIAASEQKENTSSLASSAAVVGLLRSDEGALAAAFEQGNSEVVESRSQIEDWLSLAGPSSTGLIPYKTADCSIALRAARAAHSFPRDPNLFGKLASNAISVLQPQREIAVHAPSRSTEPAWFALFLPGSEFVPLIDPVAGLAQADNPSIPNMLEILSTIYRRTRQLGCPGSVTCWYFKPIAASLERLRSVEGVERLVSPESGPALVNRTRWLPLSYLTTTALVKAFERCAPAAHCLIHGDLGLENIVATRGKRESISVIDTGCGLFGDYVYDLARLFSSARGVPYLPDDCKGSWNAEPFDEQLQRLTLNLKLSQAQQNLHDHLLTAIERQIHSLAGSFENPETTPARQRQNAQARFLLALSRIFLAAADSDERKELDQHELGTTNALVGNGLIFLNLSFSYLFCGEVRNLRQVLRDHYPKET